MCYHQVLEHIQDGDHPHCWDAILDEFVCVVSEDTEFVQSVTVGELPFRDARHVLAQLEL